MARPTKTRDSFKCLNCGAEKEMMHHLVSKNKFCNPACRGEYKQFLNKQKWLNGDSQVIERTTIRRYITEERGYKCECCNISNWNNKPLTLQVDHIDGNPSNHKPNNVRLICPNCHSQQENWGARNKGSGRKSRGMSLA
jgi:5-methylcytosine-specific restriction endonuclease McrA